MLANCPKCGQLFNKVTKDICPKCIEEEEQLLRDTQEFLRNNRNAGRHQIMLEVDGVTPMHLDQWIETKRINLITAEDIEEQQEKANKQKQLLQKIMSGKSKAPAKEKEKDEEDKPDRHGMHFRRDK